MKVNHFFGLGIVALFSCMFASCMDDKYDLDNVDMTIGTKVDLWLPESSTSEVRLASFMDLEDIGFIDTVFNEEFKDTIFYARTSGYFELFIQGVLDGEIEFRSDNPPILIAELPDFLKEEGVCLDLDNPVIIADVDPYTPPKGTLEVDFGLKSWKNDEKLDSCDVEGLEVTSSKASWYVARKEEFLPERLLNPEFGEPSFLPLGEGQCFSDLLINIPDRIETHVNKLKATGFGNDYAQLKPCAAKVNLQIYAPLSVGPNFKMKYKTDVDGWADEFGDDLEDLVVSKSSKIVVEALVDNDVPLDAEIEVVAIDKNGNDIVHLPKLTQKVTAKTKDNLRYTLETAKNSKYTILDFISGTNNAPVLDGIRVVCSLSANDEHLGEYLRSTTFIKMSNIRIGIMGDITYDAN